MLDYLVRYARGKVTIIALVLIVMGFFSLKLEMEDWGEERKFNREGETAIVSSYSNLNHGTTQGATGANTFADLDFRTAAGKHVHVTQRFIEPQFLDMLMAKKAVEIRYLVDDPTQFRTTIKRHRAFGFLSGLVLLGLGGFFLRLCFREH